MTPAFEMHIHTMRYPRTSPRNLFKINILRQVIAAHQAELSPLLVSDTPDDCYRLFERIVKHGLKAIQAEENTCTFQEAAERSIEARNHRRPATLHDLRYFTRRMLKVPGIAQRPLRAMTTRECRKLLDDAFSASMNSYKKGRAILHSIFNFGIRREWCDRNPVDKIEVPVIQEKTISPLPLQTIHQLEKTCEQKPFRDMRLSLKLMLYCGLRPAEVSRLNPQRDIDWKLGHVLIRPRTSKTGGGRMIPLRAVARVPEDERLIPLRWEKKWRQLRRAAGLARWQADACRHTFASYHAAHFRNLAALQLEMGHRDTALLFSRYMIPIPPNQARAFWKGKQQSP